VVDSQFLDVTVEMKSFEDSVLIRPITGFTDVIGLTNNSLAAGNIFSIGMVSIN
jgi:hypothetical protein